MKSVNLADCLCFVLLLLIDCPCCHIIAPRLWEQWCLFFCFLTPLGFLHFYCLPPNPITHSFSILPTSFLSSKKPLQHWHIFSVPRMKDAVVLYAVCLLTARPPSRGTLILAWWAVSLCPAWSGMRKRQNRDSRGPNFSSKTDASRKHNV